jgi:hypothetical protein
MALRVLPWLLLFVLAGCMEGQKPTPQQKKALSERAGSEPTLSATSGATGASHVAAHLGFSLPAARPDRAAVAVGGPLSLLAPSRSFDNPLRPGG